MLIDTTIAPMLANSTFRLFISSINASRSGRISFNADYRLLVDNLLDPTHAEFIHRTSFGSSDWQAAREAGAEPEQRSGEFEVEIRDDGKGIDKQEGYPW